MDNYIITIARSFGSGGKEIASLLSEKLGIPWYERQILTMASQASGIDESEFVEVDEKLQRKLSYKVAHKAADGKCSSSRIKSVCVGFEFVQYSGGNYRRAFPHTVLYHCRKMCRSYSER